QPEATQPEATQPEATQPEATQPEATQPTATQSKTAQLSTPDSRASKPARRNRGPKVVVFAAPKKGKVTFPHRDHQKRKIPCATCHHTLEPHQTPKACRTCHGEQPDAPAMRTAAHKRCRACHKAKGKGPTACKDCHAK
ncbi:MAG: hypothetical protein D6729_02145, partial [Deltaproteobacteria bacterium]